MKPIQKKLVITAGVLVALLAVHFGLSAVAELWYGTTVKNLWALNTPFFLRVFWPFVLLLLIGGYGALMFSNGSEKAGSFLVGVAVLGVLGSFIPGSPTVSAANRSGFEAKQTYLSNVRVTTDAHPEYLERPNFVQAAKIITETVNDSTVGGFTQAQYTVANGEPAWCVGVLSIKDGRGRQYVNGVRCLNSENKVEKAEFKGRVPSMNGSFSTNLRKQIAEAKPGMSINEMDVRYAIVGNKAISVASVTRIARDAYTPHQVPGGVFVFDETGAMEYREEVKSGDFDFAVLPYSIAEEVRSALNTRAGYWCMNHLTKAKCTKKNQALEDTQHVAGAVQQGDVNAENYSEFVLHRANGTIGMVTPLTMYGKGRNVVAYLDVDADTLKANQMPKATLYEGVMEVSNRLLAQTITPAYTADITWITEIGGASDMASGSRIYEVTPTKAGEVVATIGTATNPQYKVTVAASVKDDSLDFTWCISDLNTGKQIECRSRANGEAAIGTLRGIASQSPAGVTTETEETKVSKEFDVSELSVEELQKLINDAAKELADR
jgi:hypothetical protein